MRTYEALYIIAPNLDDDAIQAVVAGVENLITSNGGTIVRSEVWGRRKLAYEIKKHSEGVYVLLRFTASPEFVKKLDNHFKLAETVIRSMVLYLDERTLRARSRAAAPPRGRGAHRRHPRPRVRATTTTTMRTMRTISAVAAADGGGPAGTRMTEPEG